MAGKAFSKNDGRMLEDETFVRFLLAAFPPPSDGPTSTHAPITRLGPGRVSLALSLVTPLQKGLSSFHVNGVSSCCTIGREPAQSLISKRVWGPCAMHSTKGIPADL